MKKLIHDLVCSKAKSEQGICAIRIRKACPLSDSRWMTIPWTYHPKTPKDLLIDIVVELPGLCEGIDSLNSLGKSSAAPRLRAILCRRAFEMIKKLAIWEATFSKSTSFLEINNTVTLPETIPGHDLANCHLMTYFWGISLNVYGQIVSILDHADASQLNPEECCRRIIRSIPLLLHPSVGIFRQHLVPFPIISCCAYMTGSKSPPLQPERELLASFFQKGYFVAMHQFMKSMNSQITQFTDST